MAKCKMCEGWGFVRDLKRGDGYARDGSGNGIPCPPPEKGGCGGAGATADQPELESQA